MLIFVEILYVSEVILQVMEVNTFICWEQQFWCTFDFVLDTVSLFCASKK